MALKAAGDYVSKVNSQNEPPRWRRGRAFDSHAGDGSSIPGRDRPNLLKQVVFSLFVCGVSSDSRIFQLFGESPLPVNGCTF